MVFHTAPPHPASNARITCSPQLVGGALASQNGLGHLMPPAKFVVRSANSHLPALAQRSRNPQSRSLSVRNSVYHLASAIHAITARKILWICSLPGSTVNHHPSALHSNSARLRQQVEQRRLPNRGNHHIALHDKRRILHRNQQPRLVPCHRHACQLNPAFSRLQPHGQCRPLKLHALAQCMLILKVERRNIFPLLSVQDRYCLCAQPLRRTRRIDRRIPRANHHHPRRHAVPLPRLVSGNKLQRIDHISRSPTLNLELVHGTQPHAQKHSIELPLKLCQPCRIDVSALELDAQPEHHLNLAQTVRRA